MKSLFAKAILIGDAPNGFTTPYRLRPLSRPRHYLALLALAGATGLVALTGQAAPAASTPAAVRAAASGPGVPWSPQGGVIPRCAPYTPGC